jgi:hypothetical protein
MSADLVLGNGAATVTVTTESTTRADDGAVVPLRFVVTGSSGYRADIPACYCEGRTPCGKPEHHPVNGKTSGDAYWKHYSSHCHGWHPPRVERFAAAVLATYPKPSKGRGAAADNQLDLFADLDVVA